MRAALWRFRPHGLLAAAVAGIGLSPLGPVAVAAAVLVAGAVGAAVVPGSGVPADAVASRCGLFGAGVPRAAAALVAAQVVAAGALFGDSRMAGLDRPAGGARPGAALHASVVVLERPRPARFGSTAVVRVESGAARGLKALARFAPHARATRVSVGSRLRVRGFVRRPRPPDGFDYDAFLRSRAVLRQIQVDSAAVAGRRGGVAGALDRVRERAERGLASGRDPARAAVARGMVLGQDEAVDEATRDDFRRSGLAHLLAASGQNVMLLCALALPLLALAGFGRRGRALALVVLIAVYVPLAGAGASIVRAGIMGGAAIVAMLAGRPDSRLYALLLAAALTLGWNPRASGDPAWQLSFAAVAGIALCAGPLSRVIERRLPEGRTGASPAARRGPVARSAVDGLAITIAATTATAPLMAHHFEAVSLAALPANLLVLPAVGPVMWIGLVQAVAGQLAAPGDAVAGVLGSLQDPLIAWIAGVARTLADPAWAQAEVRLSWPGVAVAFLVLGLLAAALRRRRPPDPAAPRPGIAAAALVCFLGAAVLLVALVPPPPPRGLRVDFLDVGQGDATLVRDATGAAVLFDGGPPEARVAALLRRLGVRRLSAVVATHMSRDHHGGLAEVLRRFDVGVLLDGGDGTTDASYRALLRTAHGTGVRRVAATAGVRLRAGGLVVRVLAPAPPGRGGAAPATPVAGAGATPAAPGSDADPNLRAVVAVVEARGFRLLLTADAESPSLLPLRLPRVDAMKVPHHGSSDPGLPAVLRRVRPRIAAIEVGAGNRYGHPAPSTLHALRAVPRVFRTDRHGTVSLELDGGRAVVRTARPPT